MLKEGKAVASFTGFTVKYYWYQIGSADLLHSFFSTVAYRLEKGKWGSVYPVLMNELYQGEVSAESVPQAQKELKDIKEKLKGLAPDQAIWDIDDLSKQPPWKDETSTDITDLSNCYVTSDGEDLITIFEHALQKAEELKMPLMIKTL